MRKTQSQNIWLRRQNKDTFVKQSKASGYRSRAAYKLLDINKKFNIIRKGNKIIDLGSSPGAWSQVILEKIKNFNFELIAIDKCKMKPLKNCNFILDDIENFLINNNSLKKKYL